MLINISMKIIQLVLLISLLVWPIVLVYNKLKNKIDNTV